MLEDGGYDPVRGSIVEQAKYIQNPGLLFWRILICKRIVYAVT